MLGLELVQDQQTKEPATELGALLGEQFTTETGVIVRGVGNNLIFPRRSFSRTKTAMRSPPQHARCSRKTETS